MPKKIKFESFRYRFLVAAEAASYQTPADSKISWRDFIKSLGFVYAKGRIEIAWQNPTSGTLEVALDEPVFFLRGDDQERAARQSSAGLTNSEDPVKISNGEYFAKLVERVAAGAGFGLAENAGKAGGRITLERDFHDGWAAGEDIEAVDIRKANEACTAPEMRYITQQLGDIRGKRLLDVGCGLGEASVYFALLGANVTATDLSPGMLDATRRQAARNGVSVATHLSAAEDLQLPADARFDIIYAGNLLHHVDIDMTLSRISRHLAADGRVVTWDPVAYNPAINVYRAIATSVRTPDEHPLRWQDVRLFRRHFGSVQTRYFWLTTLLVFLIMALVQRRNPNKERFWKVVVAEGEKWRWVYVPLERLDRILLAILPPLRLLCWNVVVIARAKAP